MNHTLKIDIVSDVSCPWCIIGYQSLAIALGKLATENSPSITWKPFELNPHMPAEGQRLDEHLHEKYGTTAAETEQTRQMITARGAAVGFGFNFRDEGRIYNTFDAHRLLFWARESGKQTELKLALFARYFSEGSDLGNPEVLAGAAANAGLPLEEARQILASDRYATEVREEEAKYLAMGVASVPTFIINDQYKITGGQPVAAFIEILEKIVAEECAANA